MAAKRKFKLDNFFEVLTIKSGLSTGAIARRLKCNISTARRYLRELKRAKQVIEQRISNTINLWKLAGKRILLVDVDSTIPNLALMKISAYHKEKGNSVRLVKIKLRRHKDGTLKEGVKVDLSEKPDKMYISVVFKKNRPAVDEFTSKYPELDIDIGGSGYDLHKELPSEIEALKPDYSLYPENDSSYGFSSRGCIRNNKSCPWCIVPEKEHFFRRAQHPSEWYNPKFEKIVFLDNNILADTAWFFEITDWCLSKKLKIWFTQGLDIRLLDIDIARQLLKFKDHHMLTFAWDDLKYEKTVRQGIELLKDAGFTRNMLRSHVQFYVYVGSDNDYESGVYRCRELKKLSCNSFVMYNIENEQTSRITDLKRWSKGKCAYWSFDVSAYKRNIRTAKTISGKCAKGTKATG